MTWRTFDELIEAPTPKTFVSEAIDFSFDFVVHEVAQPQPKLRLVVNNERKEPTDVH